MFRFVILSCLLVAAAAGPPVVKSRAEIDSYKSVLEKSRQDDGLTLEERMAENPEMTAWASSGKFEGDILLDDLQIEDLVDSYTSGRAAFIRANTRWPNGVLVYEFGNGEFNLDQQRHIVSVMNTLSTRTCVRTRLRTASDRNFVRITGRATGCYAHVGYSALRGVHTLNLARANPGQGCLNSVVVAHELLHNYGFFHMQSTHNRDTYVRIHLENVQRGMEHNFDRYAANTVSNLGLPYEYGSCMHYGTHFFSSNGRPTLSTTRPYNGVLGQTVRITALDIQRLARHYNCPGAWSARRADYALVENGQGELVEEEWMSPELEEMEMLEPVETQE